MAFEITYSRINEHSRNVSRASKGIIISIVVLYFLHYPLTVQQQPTFAAGLPHYYSRGRTRDPHCSGSGVLGPAKGVESAWILYIIYIIYRITRMFCEYQTYANFAGVDQITKPKLVLVNTHDPCQNTIQFFC